MNSTDDTWMVDIAARLVRHSCGMTIVFEGVPESTHFAGSPQNMPRDKSPLEIATLIREGFEAFRVAFMKDLEKRPILYLKSR